MHKPKVSFITINYNSSVFTIGLLKSIEKYTTIEYEVIVVDNKSKESDIQNLEKYIDSKTKIRLVRNAENEGFAAGNMLGASFAQAQYMFFINNDTQLLNDTASIIANYMDIHMDISLATAKVEDENGNFSSSYKLFPSVVKELFGNSVARKFTKYNFPSNKVKLDKPSLVEVVSGSCMFFRADTFHDIGGFDTEFFLYCEEEDISKRVWLSGKKVAFVPDAKIIHYSGGSSQKSFEMEREYYISYFILLKKHFGFFSRNFLLILLLVKLFRRSFKRNYGKKIFYCALQGCLKANSLRNIG